MRTYVIWNWRSTKNNITGNIVKSRHIVYSWTQTDTRSLPAQKAEVRHCSTYCFRGITSMDFDSSLKERPWQNVLPVHPVVCHTRAPVGCVPRINWAWARRHVSLIPLLSELSLQNLALFYNIMECFWCLHSCFHIITTICPFLLNLYF